MWVDMNAGLIIFQRLRHIITINFLLYFQYKICRLCKSESLHKKRRLELPKHLVEDDKWFLHSSSIIFRKSKYYQIGNV